MAARPAGSLNPHLHRVDRLRIALAIALVSVLVSPLSPLGSLLAPGAAADDTINTDNTDNTDNTENTCRAKPIVVKIHADWCATCKRLDAIWTQLDTDMGDQVQVVTLDVSDRVAFQESQATAKELGLEDFFQEYRSKTGTIAVLDCNSREPVAVMNGELDLGKYREAIAEASRSS
jgi:thiol-disulfide isomerase/thioredoxin